MSSKPKLPTEQTEGSHNRRENKLTEQKAALKERLLALLEALGLFSLALVLIPVPDPILTCQDSSPSAEEPAYLSS